MKRYTLGAAFVVFVITLVLLLRLVGPSPQQAVSFIRGVTPTPMPTPTPAPELSEVFSPDGSMKVIEKKVSQASGAVAYTFSTQVGTNAAGSIFQKTTVPGEELLLAANGWSPDNRFVFVLDRQRAGLGALVFQKAGEPFADGLIYHDVGALFRAVNTEYTIRDITGWDSPTLIHVTTNAATGRGPSYWFDVPSSSFIQLSSL
jgi:hypothetical protein